MCRTHAAGYHERVSVPDRGIIPLMTAVAAGFIAGLIGAVKELSGGSAWALAIPVGVAVAISGIVSVVKAPGEESERWVVGALRALCAVAVFAFLFLAFLRGLRDGSPLGILLFVVAAAFAVLLTRFRVRDRGELEQARSDAEPERRTA